MAALSEDRHLISDGCGSDVTKKESGQTGFGNYLVALTGSAVFVGTVMYGLHNYLNYDGCTDDVEACAIGRALGHIWFNGKQGVSLAALHAHNCNPCWMNNHDSKSDGATCKSPSLSDMLPCDCTGASCVYIHCSTYNGPRYVPVQAGVCFGRVSVNMSIAPNGMESSTYIIIQTIVTTTMSDVIAGDSHMEIGDYSGFSIGDTIAISDGVHTEERDVIGFGCIIVDRPLSFNYSAGASISIIQSNNAAGRYKSTRSTTSTTKATIDTTPTFMQSATSTSPMTLTTKASTARPTTIMQSATSTSPMTLTTKASTARPTTAQTYGFVTDTTTTVPNTTQAYAAAESGITLLQGSWGDSSHIVTIVGTTLTYGTAEYFLYNINGSTFRVSDDFGGGSARYTPSAIMWQSGAKFTKQLLTVAPEPTLPPSSSPSGPCTCDFEGSQCLTDYDVGSALCFDNGMPDMMDYLDFEQCSANCLSNDLAMGSVATSCAEGYACIAKKKKKKFAGRILGQNRSTSEYRFL